MAIADCLKSAAVCSTPLCLYSTKLVAWTIAAFWPLSLTLLLRRYYGFLYTAPAVFDIIQRFSSPDQKDGRLPGRSHFLDIIRKQIDHDQPIKMVLPAFPFKSPNRKEKVLGALPDLGEELALGRLEGLCEEIEKVYPPGAEVTILSDGLVYNDIFGISDEDVWEYGQGLRRMAAVKSPHIKFARLWDMLGRVPDTFGADKTYYHAHAGRIRGEIIAKYGDPSLDVRQLIEDDDDVRLTYCGYKKFLAKDLEHCVRPGTSVISQLDTKALSKNQFDRKIVAPTAKQTIKRGVPFAAAIEEHFGDDVRLSIHPSKGMKKVPICLIPQEEGRVARKPWQCCIAVSRTGRIATVHADEVRETHDLEFRGDGRPYCYRERYMDADCRGYRDAVEEEKV